MTNPPQPAGDESAPAVINRGRRVWWISGVVAVLAIALSGGLRLKNNSEKTQVAKKGRNPPRATAVRVATARRATLPLIEEYRGELTANTAELATQRLGRVLEVKVDLGDRFKKGDVLARVDASETQRALSEARAQVKAVQATIKRSQAELAAAEVEVRRARKLLDAQLLSEQEAMATESRVKVLRADIDAGEAQRLAARARVQLYTEQLSQATLVAPFDGAVAERYLDPGSMAPSGARILRLVENGPQQVRFRASEQHLKRLTVGAPLLVKTRATAEVTHAGHVVRVSAEVTRSDRTIAIEGVLEEEHPTLKPGMYATVLVEFGVIKQATLVPAAAIVRSAKADTQDDAEQWSVFVVESGVARRRDIRVLGRQFSASMDSTQRTSGAETAVAPLAPGARVAVFGHDALKEGDRVRVVESQQ